MSLIWTVATALAEGSRREVGPGSSQDGAAEAAGDSFSRLVSSHIFGIRHTEYALVLCTYRTSLCVSVV